MKKYFNIKLLSIVLWVVIYPGYLVAQNNNDNNTLKRQPRLSGHVYTFSVWRAQKDYYFNDTWLNGDVLLASGEKVQDKSIKYNGYLDELVWFSEESHQPVQVDKQMVEKFTFNDIDKQEPVVFKKIKLDGSFVSSPRDIFAQKLYVGDISLLVYRRVIESGSSVVEYEGSSYSLPNFSAVPEYYILMPDTEVLEVNSFSRRALYSLFPEYRDNIRDTFRQERIRIRSEEDLIDAVSLIDHILSK